MLSVYFFVAISAGFGCLREEPNIVLIPYLPLQIVIDESQLPRVTTN